MNLLQNNMPLPSFVPLLLFWRSNVLVCDSAATQTPIAIRMLTHYNLYTTHWHINTLDSCSVCVCVFFFAETTGSPFHFRSIPFLCLWLVLSSFFCAMILFANYLFMFGLVSSQDVYFVDKRLQTYKLYQFNINKRTNTSNLMALKSTQHRSHTHPAERKKNKKSAIRATALI